MSARTSDWVEMGFSPIFGPIVKGFRLISMELRELMIRPLHTGRASKAFHSHAVASGSGMAGLWVVDNLELM